MELDNKNAAVHNGSAAFFLMVNNRLKFSLFLLKTLPAAWCSGLRIREADETHCTVSVPFKWFTQNPFRSTYFACLSMAAEMSTGLLAMASIYKRKPAVSMLIIRMQATYHKKATGLTYFICRQGNEINSAIENAIITNEPVNIQVRSEGRSEEGNLVAEFEFTWSFKVKRSK